MPMINGSNADNLMTIWRATTDRTRTIRADALLKSQQSAAAPMPAEVIMKFGSVIEDAIAQFEFAQTKGDDLVDFGRIQIREPTRDIAGEYAAMLTTLMDMRTALINGFPNSGGNLHEHQWGGDGKARYIHTMFASDSTIAIAFRARLDAIVSSIDAPLAP